MSEAAPALRPAVNPFKEFAERYARDPYGWVVAVFAVKPDPWQEKNLKAIGNGERRLSIRSGHGVGKSTFLAWVLLWFACTRFPYKAVVTAPTAPQLFDALWAELRAWFKKLPATWQLIFDVTTDRIALKQRPDEAFISARTSRAESPDSLQGIHSRHVLLVADEAPGVPEKVFEAAGGSMSTPGAITILAGNPTKTSGFFWRTHVLEADRWFCTRVSSTDSPRVDPAWCREIAERWGLESNNYRVRVLGEFPISDGDTYIPAGLVESAMQRAVDIDIGVPEIWGLDVARFGTDSSVLIKRRGRVVVDVPRRWTQLDLMGLTGHVMAEWRAADNHRPAVIVVDSVGLGSGVADRLRELKVPTLDMNPSETLPSNGRFVRMRDEVWDRMRTWFEGRDVAIPADDMLRDSLVIPKYGFTSDGKLRLETKSEMRSRGFHSPDDADALALTFTPAAATASATATHRWSQPLRRGLRGIV